MADITVHDKAKYHFEGTFPKDLSPDQALVHTGFFLGWLADRRLLSPEVEIDFPYEIAAFRRRELSGPQLYSRLGGTFDDTMLTDEGKKFTNAYFDFEDGLYISDYQDILTKGLPSFYHVNDTWSNYFKIAGHIDQRYAEWRTANEAKH